MSIQKSPSHPPRRPDEVLKEIYPVPAKEELEDKSLSARINGQAMPSDEYLLS